MKIPRLTRWKSNGNVQNNNNNQEVNQGMLFQDAKDKKKIQTVSKDFFRRTRRNSVENPTDEMTKRERCLSMRGSISNSDDRMSKSSDVQDENKKQNVFHMLSTTLTAPKRILSRAVIGRK